MEQKKDQVTFEYKISPNYSIYAVSGLTGGLTPRGEMVANFFYERQPIPKKVTNKVNEDNTLGEEISSDSSDSFIRDVMFGIAMNPKLARTFAKWMNDRADEYEKHLITKEQGEKDDTK